MDNSSDMNNNQLLIDGHVHFCRPEHVQIALSAASANFRSSARTMGLGIGYGLLLLTDSQAAPGFDWASRLDHCHTEKELSNNWKIVTKSNDSVLHMTKEDALPIALLGGRQVISSENLEVLIVPRSAAGEEDRPLAHLVAQAVERGGLVILPWGVGKWLGQRGKLVSNILGHKHNASIFVGDNGGRPRIWKRVRILEDARAAGIPNIAGTDPLPVQGEEQRIGTFGVSIPAAVDQTWTSVDFLDLLREGEFRPFGRHMPLNEFLKKQIALRMTKRS